MHLHAHGAADQGPPPLGLCLPFDAIGAAYDPARPWGETFMGLMKAPPCDNPVWSPETDEALRDETLAVLERLNVIGVLGGGRARVAEWKALAPDRIIAGHDFILGPDSPSAEDMAAYHDAGGFEVLAEVANQYAGVAPNDPRFDAYWAMAEARDIPVGIHIGVGPPGSSHIFPGYRAALYSPFQLEDILIRHPRLRVYVMHASWPLRDEILAMLYSYPQLHVETGVLQMAVARAEYYDFLEGLVRAGFHRRIMFGSDQMVWPAMIEEGVRAIEAAPFLTAEQKRDILYNNAARFLRLDDETRARHEAMGRRR
jgi:predicted TIM-barrel fold metal-dependent hydrolase